MESNRNNFDRNIREALSKYESRFMMPDNLIADTMAGIVRQKERRAYIRGLVAASVAVVLMIACATFLILYLSTTTPEPLLSSNISIGSTMTGVTSVVRDIFSNPFILMIAGATAILLSLDHIMRSRFAMRRQSDVMSA